MWLFQIILMSVSLSIDALGVGVSYEMKGIRFPGYVIALIGAVNAVVMWVSLTVSERLLVYFPERVAGILGSALLVLIGATFIRKSLFEGEEAAYDMDASKDINLWEGLLLGAALSVDSLSAGLALSALHFQSLAVPVCVGLTQSIFLKSGICFGRMRNVGKNLNSKKSGVFAGALLIFIGLIRII